MNSTMHCALQVTASQSTSVTGVMLTGLGAAARGELSVRIGAEFPLERAADAHRALEGRQTTGKVLLRPTG